MNSEAMVGARPLGVGRTSVAAPGAIRLSIGVLGLLLGLAGCAVVPPPELAASPTPEPTPSVSGPVVSAPPSASGTPATPGAATVTPLGSPSASASATATPASVKATGSLITFSNTVSDKLVGTCHTTKSGPGFALSDPTNDFYGTVGVAVSLNTARAAVEGVRVDFGEDFEGTVRVLKHPDTGTSATISASGSRYTVKGTLRMYEGNSKSGSAVPFTLTVECASSSW